MAFPLLISAALWSDPKIAKELERGLEITKEMLNNDSEADESLTTTAQSEEKPPVGKLPTSQIKVNRLVGGKP